jgi:Tat protein translocase TatB subunit
MFGIGMPELVLIFVLALLIFGPKELPKIARTLGKAMAELRRASDELRDGIQREIELAEREEEKSASPPETAPSTTLTEATPPAPETPPSQAAAGAPAEGSGPPPGSVAVEAPTGPITPASGEQVGETPAEEMVEPTVTPVASETDKARDGQEVPGDHRPEAKTASPTPSQPVETRNA